MEPKKNISFFNSMGAQPTREYMLDYEKLQSMDFLKGLLDSIPFIVAIINKDRQIIYSNEYTVESLGFRDLQEVLGTYPGNILHCTNANGYPKGCGTTQKCRVCSVLSTILDAREKQQRLTREARLVAQVNGKTYSLNLLVTSSPFIVQNHLYQIVIINDISNEKRRRILERIFFHDVINKSGSLMGLVKLLQITNNPVQQQELLDDLGNIATDLTEEILSQRDLAAAENGELKVTFSKINSLKLLDIIGDQIKYHDVAHKKQVVIDNRSESHNFHSDTVLINRVITNMIKNALEAIEVGQVVAISCYSKNGSILFRVHNPGYIPKDIQLQIFMRSFSTKSINRGLGTYSMKLIAEQYLHGEVYFKTNKQNGTSFYLKLPLSN